jgi:hypothetical protein
VREITCLRHADENKEKKKTRKREKDKESKKRCFI